MIVAPALPGMLQPSVLAWPESVMVGAALVPTTGLQSTPAQASVLRWSVAIGSVTEMVMAGNGVEPAEPMMVLVPLVAGPPSEMESLSFDPW